MINGEEKPIKGYSRLGLGMRIHLPDGRNIDHITVGLLPTKHLGTVA